MTRRRRGVALLVWSPVWVPLLAVEVAVGWALHARDLLMSGRRHRRYSDQPGRW